MIRGEVYGNLYLTEKADGGDFDEATRSCDVLADWAAIAIDNARLYRRPRPARDELERAVRGLEATARSSPESAARRISTRPRADREAGARAGRRRSLRAARWRTARLRVAARRRGRVAGLDRGG